MHAPVQYKYQYSEHWHDWVTALAECKQPGTLMTEAGEPDWALRSSAAQLTSPFARFDSFCPLQTSCLIIDGGVRGSFADGTAANSLTQLMGALLCAEGVTGKLVRDEKQFAEVGSLLPFLPITHLARSALNLIRVGS